VSEVLEPLSWQSPGLIAELAYRFKEKRFLLCKRALQRLIYLLQGLFGIDCGYEFDIGFYGFNSPVVEKDLFLLERAGAVRLVPVMFSHHVAVGENCELIRQRVKDFLNQPKVSDALDRQISDFGKFSSKELDVILAVVYITRRGNGIPREALIKEVKSFRVRFSEEKIIHFINELQKKGYIKIQEG